MDVRDADDQQPLSPPYVQANLRHTRLELVMGLAAERHAEHRHISLRRPVSSLNMSWYGKLSAAAALRPSQHVNDHIGISNVAPADCPLIPLLVPKAGQSEEGAVDQARIHDHISKLRFSLSPTAFFQFNTLAAERLYTLAGDWANLNSDTSLFDLCCGTGTIGLTLAHRVGMVVGIEMNESAVLDAFKPAPPMDGQPFLYMFKERFHHLQYLEKTLKLTYDSMRKGFKCRRMLELKLSQWVTSKLKQRKIWSVLLRRSEEIISGAQRVHTPELPRERERERGIACEYYILIHGITQMHMGLDVWCFCKRVPCGWRDLEVWRDPKMWRRMRQRASTVRVARSGGVAAYEAEDPHSEERVRGGGVRRWQRPRAAIKRTLTPAGGVRG